MQRVIYCAIVIMSVLGIISCKPGIPRKYLQPNKMADIIYDYHIAEGIQSVNWKSQKSSNKPVKNIPIILWHYISEG